MSKFSETIKEFQIISGEKYRALKDSLEEENCWKCPMRSTSKNSNCKELHAWLKIQKALENGVSNQIEAEKNPEKLMNITARFFEKRYKKENSQDYGAKIILKVSKDLPNIPAGKTIIVDPKPKSLAKNDIILVAKEFPCPISWFFKAGLLAGVPFTTKIVDKFYHKGSLWFLETSTLEKYPLPLIMGRVDEILDL